MHWSASHRWKEICYGEKSWNNWSQYFCTWTTRCGVVSPKEKAQRKIEIWLYMVWSWPNLVSRLNWVKRDEKLHFSVKGKKKQIDLAGGLWGLCRNCQKNQLKCRSIYHPSSYFIAAVALFVSRLFFFHQPRRKWKLVAKSRCDARLESPRSLVEFRPVIHV